MNAIKKYPGVVVLIIAVLLLIALTASTDSSNNTADNDQNNTETAEQENKDNDQENNQGSADNQTANNNSEDQNADSTKTPSNDTPSQQANTYIAQPGDTYSELARKAVQAYGINNKVNLSQAQIVAAETQLAAKAGFPELSEGQQVQFSLADVKTAVDYARGLAAAQQAEWQAYVPYVDFNTNDNGEMTGGSIK